MITFYIKISFFLTPNPEKTYDLLIADLAKGSADLFNRFFSIANENNIHKMDGERNNLKSEPSSVNIDATIDIDIDIAIAIGVGIDKIEPAALENLLKQLNDFKLKQFVQQLNQISLTDRKTLLKYILQENHLDSHQIIDDVFLITHAQKELPPKVLSQLHQAISRLIDDYPLAYLIQSQAFYGLSLMVTPDVLIPRPETELLVQKGLDLLEETFQKNKNNPDFCLNILELGTGSGAISIALHQELSKKIAPQHFKITALDICEKALLVAKKNAEKYSAAIYFMQSNWFSDLPYSLDHNNIAFDLIITNPPYIGAFDTHLQGSIRFEPLHALTDLPDIARSYFSKEAPVTTAIDCLENLNTSQITQENASVDSKKNDVGQGLSHIQTIIKDAKVFLKPAAYLLIEHGYDQKQGVAELFMKHGYQNTSCQKDFQNNDRYSFANI
jgi:release factor glutamine methyltransferase